LRTNRALCLLLLGGACVDQSAVTPNAPSVVVHAVLDASARDQVVKVQTTTGVETQQRDVSGARVTIETPNHGSVAGVEAPDTGAVTIQGVKPLISIVYKFSFAQLGGVVAGGTYGLHIVLPDGREVRGVTTVPSANATSTTTVLPLFDAARDTLSLAWPAARGASAFEVYIKSASSSFTMFADTTAAIPGGVDGVNGRGAFWPGLAHRAIVSAVDANFYDYYRRTSDFFTGRGVITHLDGAIGVFGSVVPVASYSFMVR
jgi:hypothetical protein